jgi:acyl-CoA thioesterase-1
VPPGTTVVILQPGGNDKRKGEIADRARNISTIQSRLAARSIKVIMIENSMLHGLPHQADGQHLTPDGYHMLAAAVLSQVESSIHCHEATP